MQCFALEGGFKPPKIYHLKSNCFHRVPHENCKLSVYTSRWFILPLWAPLYGIYSQECHKLLERIRNLHHVPHHIAVQRCFGTLFIINILELQFFKQIFCFCWAIHHFCTHTVPSGCLTYCSELENLHV